jgi:Zn finger protein HypA/HybF involved in hydrogenase expression
MVKKVIKKDKRYFMCEACNMFYETEELAQKCENFCNKHKGCSLEITKHAINID